MIFKIEPEDFKKEIDVVACYIEHAGDFILLHRQNNKTNGGKWGLPAGKMDAGENMFEAMSREILEETGISIPQDALTHIDSVHVRNLGHDLGYHMFVTRLDARPQVTINPQEHQNFAWSSPTGALQMDLIHDLGDCIKMYYR